MTTFRGSTVGCLKKVKVPALSVMEITELRNAASLNWSAIDLSIFGTLFERGLDSSQAHPAGRALHRPGHHSKNRRWRLLHGYEFKTNPVLEPLDHLEFRDALLAFGAGGAGLVEAA